MEFFDSSWKEGFPFGFPIDRLLVFQAEREGTVRSKAPRSEERKGLSEPKLFRSKSEPKVSFGAGWGSDGTPQAFALWFPLVRESLKTPAIPILIPYRFRSDGKSWA